MLKRILLLATLALFFLGTTAVLLYKQYQQFLETPLNISTDSIFIVDSGMTFAEIAARLKAKKIIEDTLFLKLLARHSGKANKIKTGEYSLDKGLKPEGLLDVLVSGKVIQYSYTLLEGWQAGEMLLAIRRSELLKNTLPSDNPEELMMLLGHPEKNAEGLFFPDTYHFPKGTTDLDFLKRAYKRLETVLHEEWQDRAENLPYQTPYEALIMASIIEKETGLASERATIAGVFVRRLQKNMKLQTDPTVIYAMGKQFNGNIRKKDLSIDSPYNTYRYKGLPPGPIALVGREAIHAALHPEDGKSLYFVAKGDGSHYFSKTLQEHNRAVAKYQLRKRK